MHIIQKENEKEMEVAKQRNLNLITRIHKYENKLLEHT